MSSIFGGGSNIFIGNGVTQNWTFTWGGSGWQGNVLNEPQPLNTGAELSYSAGGVHLNSNGTFGYDWSVTNRGPNSTFFNIQTSSS
jgi:hypothetical protein